MVNFISLGGWCGTKIALKDAGLFDKPSLPFDDVRTSIEGVIDCIENDFRNYFPKEIKKDVRFPNWIGFVGDYVGFYHKEHDLFDKKVIESFERKIRRFGDSVKENNCVFLRTVVRDNEIDQYKRLQAVIDERFPGISYIICFIIPNQDNTQYYKNLDDRTFLFTLNDKTRDDDNESIGDYTPIFNFIKSKNLFVDIPVSNDIILQPVSSRIWLVDGHPMVNKHSEPF